MSGVAFLLLLTGSGCCSPVQGPVKPIHPNVEPPDREDEFKEWETAWRYWQEATVVGEVGGEAVISKGDWWVSLPVYHLQEIRKDALDWKDSSKAHHDAVEWERTGD